VSAELEADIAYLKNIAEQGQKAPLQGGEHGVIWGGMFTASALYAYAVLTGHVPFEPWTIAVAFLIPIPVGVLLTLNLARSSGGLSFGNKTSAAAWTAVGITIGVLYLFAITAKALGFLNLSETVVMGSLQVTLFALYAVAYSATAQVAQDRRLYFFAGTAVAASLGSLFAIGTYEIFLVMAAGIFCSAVVPGFITRTK